MKCLTDVRLTVVGIYFEPEPTGIGPYNAFLARSLRAAGARVRVVTGVPHFPEWKVAGPYRRGLRWHEEHSGVHVTRVRHSVPAKNGLLGRAGLEATFFAGARLALARDRSKALIAITPSLAAVGATLAARRGRPVGVIVQDLTGEGAEQSGTSSGGVAKRIAAAEYRMLRKADLIGVITPGFGEVLISNGVNPERVVLLPNFSRVTPSPLSKAEARRLLGWPSARPSVVHTGNMGMKQSLDVVIQAAQHAPEVDFVLVGDGNQRAALSRLAVGVPNVQMLPPVSDEDYPTVLAAADVLLVNERAGVRNMSLPSKLTAYVAANRPILAAVTELGQTCQAVTASGIALVVTPSDPTALAAGVRTLLSDAPMQERLVAAQAAAFAEAQPSAARDRYVDFAERLLRSSAPT
jgi:colanic acid biosynthesis glycosyl transferase WcaI